MPTECSKLAMPAIPPGVAVMAMATRITNGGGSQPFELRVGTRACDGDFGAKRHSPLIRWQAQLRKQQPNLIYVASDEMRCGRRYDPHSCPYDPEPERLSQKRGSPLLRPRPGHTWIPETWKDSNALLSGWWYAETTQRLN